MIRKIHFYILPLFFSIFFNYSCSSNESKEHAFLAEIEARKMIKKQSNGFLKMDGFELLDSKTTKRNKGKLFNKRLSEMNNHLYHFKTKLIVQQDCNKAVIHFKGHDKNLFYNLDVVPLNKLCFHCDGQERLFKGDVYEVTCSIRYHQYKNRDEFTNIKVDNMEYKRIKDGERRSNFEGETYRTVTFMDRHNAL